MQSSKCPICKRIPSEPINLRCDHHPCFQCASSIITVDLENQLETKYKIICPICKKKTVTYDIRHLIVSVTEQDEDLYCTTKYITQKPQVLIKKSSNQTEGERNSFSSNKLKPAENIKESYNVKNKIKIECKRHPTKTLEYFCSTCFRNDNQDAFMCQQCANTHSHLFADITQAEYSLGMMNRKKIQTNMPQHKNELSKLLKQLNQRKGTLKTDYEKLEKQITEQFKKVYQSINKQYQSLKKEMKEMYTKQYQNLKNSLSLATRLKDSLSGLQKMYRLDKSQLEGQISFHNYFYEIGKAIETNKRNISKSMEFPFLIKKSIIAFEADPLIELKLQNILVGHQRKDSKNSFSIVMSPKNKDYCSQGPKSYKIGSGMHSKKQSKQNLVSGLSPRQKLSFQSLLFST